MGTELFLNDNYRILHFLYDNQTMVLDMKVIPLTQGEIGNALGMSKAKVNALLGQLQEANYVSLATRGRYVL